MSSITLEEAQAHLPEWIERLHPGEPLVITRNDKPVARLLAEEPPKRLPRKPGNCQGMMTIVADDDEHLKHFAECVFRFDPVLGLSDIDFHRITEAGWQNMKSPRPGTPANLIILPATTCQELQEAIRLIESKGGYQSVLITISEPEAARKLAG